jgi:putative chitinase
MLTKDKLYKIVPAVEIVVEIDTIVNEINAAFKDAPNERRMAMFIAQCAHESTGFTRKLENLNYSKEALLSLFGKYFDKDPAIAAQYHRQPEKIANKIYASRMGNGPTESGEGWKFRGRGYIQLTGKENYTNCGKGLGVNLIETPEYLETVEGAIKSAIWFWNSRNLNTPSDEDDVVTVTKKINGGRHGLEERTAYYNRAKEVLKTK